MERMDRRGMAVLSFAHVCDDVNQSFLPALLPMIVATMGLTDAAAGGLMLAASISSSVVQPLVGHLSDRKTLPILIPAGVFLAGAGVALAGVMPSYWLVALVVLMSGFGVAAFHPEAARFANYVSGPQKVTGMRFFTIGGNVGFALGPFFATAVLAGFGARGTLLALVPAGLAALLIAREIPRLRTFAPAKRARRIGSGSDRWTAFSTLTFYIVMRSIAFIGLVTYIPLYYVDVMHAGATQGNIALGLYLAAGAIGSFYLAPFADRIGRKRFLALSAFVSAPLMVVMAVATGATHSVLVGDTLAIVIGVVLVPSQPAMVVLGQEYLPNRLGIASGVTLGLAISLGGAASPVLGAIGDRFGLEATLLAIAAACATAAFTSLAFTAAEHVDARRSAPLVRSIRPVA